MAGDRNLPWSRTVIFWSRQAVIPEPHAFTTQVKVGADTYTTVFEEHDHGHGATGRDNNMRAAIVHVVADAAVSVSVIIGLLLARAFGWLWMDPLAGIIGACVIASWSYGLIRDTGAILLDRIPDSRLAHEFADNHRERRQHAGRSASLAPRTWPSGSYCVGVSEERAQRGLLPGEIGTLPRTVARHDRDSEIIVLR